MADEYVILVDKNDNPLGLEEKVKCHLPNGKLHRAFTALIFDKEGRLLVTRRSLSKMLWPGDWDGTVASHPREKETYVSSAERRMPEEIGISCKFDYLFKFEYHVPYKEEIAEIKWTTADELIEDLQKNPEIYCPWMLIAIYLLPNSEKSMLTKYKSVMSQWIKPEIKNPLEESIKYHLQDNNWRLVN